MTTATYTYTTWTIVAAPKFSDFQEHDCHFCAYHTLTKPVFMKSAEGQTVAAGAGCAALIMFGRKSEATKVVRQSEIANHEAQIAELVKADIIERATQALEAFNAGIQYTPELQGMRVNYNTVKPDMTFPEFLAQVAITGSVN